MMRKDANLTSSMLWSILPHGVVVIIEMGCRPPHGVNVHKSLLASNSPLLSHADDESRSSVK